MPRQARRNFLKQASLSAAAWSAAAAGAENDRVVVGVIGTGGMGMNHVKRLAARKDVELAYVCDVDRQRLENAAKQVETLAGKAPQAVSDLRKLLDDKRVDAVWIATPDHWHAPASLLGLAAGKHVYVEKPCCHNIR